MLGRRWGRQAPESKRWEKRYYRLLGEGFVHEEAARLAEGIIGSKSMMAGRRARRRWIMENRDFLQGMNAKEYEAVIDDMYDVYDWFDPYSQFYPFKERHVFEPIM